MTPFRYNASPENEINYFIVLGLSPHTDETKILTIAHYTHQHPNELKFAVETFKIGSDVTNEFIDFTYQVVQILETNYPKRKHDIDLALKRIDNCLKYQSTHNISTENMENALKYIITGEGNDPYMEDDLKVWQKVIISMKNVGHNTAIFLAAVPAVIGGLLCHPYVRLIVAAMVSYAADMTSLGDCKKQIR